MSIKSTLKMLYSGIRCTFSNAACLRKGQANNYAIYQSAHRLEKGLCIRAPRDYWGYDKAAGLARQIDIESHSKHSDKQAISIGVSVLNEYIKAKKATNNEKELSKVKELEEQIKKYKIKMDITGYGGALEFFKAEILPDSVCAEKLFLSRHSVRDFDDSHIDDAKLRKAVELALRAPSACNRQASQIYVISGEDRINAGSGNEYRADKYLIITGNKRAFSMSEMNDWIVSTSIFCGYLSLALHAEGIGSCIFRKETVRKSKYNDAVRKICNIPDDEQIILEMAIGNYKNEFNAPKSYRRNVKDILHFSGSLK